jgi:acylphosphatase
MGYGSPYMSDMDITSLRLRIEGHVQAVGYRNFVIEEARKLGVDGWVRNRSDGSVEVLACGETKAVEALIASCARGPEGSRIKHIDMETVEAPAEKGFNRRPSI